MLYLQLKSAEKNQGAWIPEEIKEYLDHWKILPGFDYNLNFPEKIDVPEYQKRLIRLYSNPNSEEYNPLLEDALKRTKRLESAWEETTRNSRGLRMFIPRGKDEEHNKKVGHLINLIGFDLNLNYAQREGIFKGIFFFHNIMRGAFILMYLSLLEKPGTNPLDPELCGLTALAMIATLPLEIYTRPRKEGKNRAKYIDDKIEELF